MINDALCSVALILYGGLENGIHWYLSNIFLTKNRNARELKLKFNANVVVCINSKFFKNLIHMKPP